MQENLFSVKIVKSKKTRKGFHSQTNVLLVS